MSRIQEIKAIYSGEKNRFTNADGDVIIGSARPVEADDIKAVKGYITIKGKADVDELQEHQTYRFYGTWRNYYNKWSGKDERQFHFQTFVQCQPHGQTGVVNYLIQAGKGRGIGRARAMKIWQKFASDAIRIAREQPEVIAAAIKGLSLDDAKATAVWLESRKALEDATIEVGTILDGRGFPKVLARQVIKKWGNEAAEKIKADPFRLMEFTGCGFKKCDALYLHMGLPADKLRRQCYAAAHSVAANSDGSTWFPAQVVANSIRRLIGNGARPATAIKMAVRIGKKDPDHHGALAILRSEGGAVVDGGKDIWLAEGRKAKSEWMIAKIVAYKINNYPFTGFWPTSDGIGDISEHQAEELAKSMQGPIAILGGSPGTGKTYTAARVISAIASEIGIGSIAAAAPTGKAAVRLTESMAEYGLDLKCRTWHSHLGVGEGGGFEHNACNPFPYKLIVADESSMLDSNLFSAIVEAIPTGCHLLLIGDINQLPPVGHGAPLRDLIAAGLPYGELTEIKRNSGGIVEACAAIRDGNPMPDDPGNLIWRPVESDHQINCCIDTIMAAREAGFDPVWDCQTLVAVNEKSPISRKAINEVLQVELNENPAIEGTPFRINDKIVNLQNMNFQMMHRPDGGDLVPIKCINWEHGDYQPDDSFVFSEGGSILVAPGGKTYVANGELAKALEVREKTLIADVVSPRRIVQIPRFKAVKGGTGCSWDLAYALSVHKAQGSEFKVVIVMLDEYPGAKRVCSREWLYTAISRAKSKCFLIGQRSVAEEMVSRTAIDKRKTFLRELTCKNLATLEMAGI